MNPIKPLDQTITHIQMAELLGVESDTILDAVLECEGRYHIEFDYEPDLGKYLFNESDSYAIAGEIMPDFVFKMIRYWLQFRDFGPCATFEKPDTIEEACEMLESFAEAITHSCYIIEHMHATLEKQSELLNK